MVRVTVGSHLYTKRFFSSIEVFLEVVIKNKIVKFQRLVALLQLRKVEGVKVQIKEF